MLDLLFGPDLDAGTAWRHLLPDGRARAGWAVCGPAGLLDRLGLLLGEPLQSRAQPLRVAAYAQRLAAHDEGHRCYSVSRSTDGWGVARYLLSLRDALRAAGWEGGPLTGSDRLRDLSELEAVAGQPLLPGEIDVLQRLILRLGQVRQAPALRLQLACPSALLSASWQKLLTALAARGVAVVEPPPQVPAAPGQTDLGRLQRRLLAGPGDGPAPQLVRDGSVVLLEGETPTAAADLLAAWLADHPAPRRTLVAAGRAALLGRALGRQGLPRLGLTGASRWRAALQLLPLRLALAFAPRDPLDALELLTLPVQPFPRRVASRLLAALGEAPGIGGPQWRAAIDECLEHAAEEATGRAAAEGAEPTAQHRAAVEARARLHEKLETWFGGEAVDPAQGLLPADAEQLCAGVAQWARRRAFATGEDGQPGDLPLAHAAAVATSLQQMLHLVPQHQPLTRPQLDQLHDTAVGAGLALDAGPGEAGRPGLCTTPGAVLPGADEVVWWGFVGDADVPAAEPWTPAERAALTAAGLRLPRPGEVRRLQVQGWRQALLAARQRVVLVRWRLDGRERVTPHPFEDELGARLAPGSLQACTLPVEAFTRDPASPRPPVAGNWQPRLAPVPAAPTVTPHPVWRLPAKWLQPPAQLSATSIGALFGCPLQWTLNYVARLRSGTVASLPDDTRLVGTFAHSLIEDLLCGPNSTSLDQLTPETARQLVQQAFDARIEGEAAPLLRPGRELERRRARATIGRATEALVGVLQQGGWRVQDTEQQVTGTFAGLPYQGYVDLTLVRPGHGVGVLDLKLGRSRNRRSELQDGRALQLALYARALAGGASRLPPTGYFSLEDGRVLTDRDGVFPGADVVAGPGAETTLRLAEAAWRWWSTMLAAGLVPARPPHSEEWQEICEQAAGPPPDDCGPIAATASCQYCDYATLCQHQIG